MLVFDGILREPLVNVYINMAAITIVLLGKQTGHFDWAMASIAM